VLFLPQSVALITTKQRYYIKLQRLMVNWEFGKRIYIIIMVLFYLFLRIIIFKMVKNEILMLKKLFIILLDLSRTNFH